MKAPQPGKVYKDGEAIEYNSYKEMPYSPMCQAFTTWNKTGSWRYLRPIYVERIPSCEAACPTANDIERWIKLLEEGKPSEALKVAKIENPFPGIMGRICFHPCESGCNRRHLGGTVSINMLERFLSDSNPDPEIPEQFLPDNNHKIAIIGSGPAGLSAAYHLKRLGYNVTVHEKEKKAGGVLRYGIPEYRLPRDIIDKEIQILENMGIKFKCAHAIKDAADMQSVRQAFDIVLLATGASKSKKLKVVGEETNSIVPALSFLNTISKGEKINVGKNVLVIGGGNTAIDAARTAKRLGADTKILYRRTREEMPAFEEEIEEALNEGIEIEELVSPKTTTLRAGKLHSLVCECMKLGDPDEDGRRSPVPITDSNKEFRADTILVAIGEEIDVGMIPSVLKIHEGALDVKAGGRTEWKDLFAVGDLIKQPRTAVDALASGKSCAIAIDCHFNEDDFDQIAEQIKLPGTNYLRMKRYIEIKKGEKVENRKDEIVDFAELNLAYFKEIKPNTYKLIKVEDRTNNFSEVKLPVDEKIAKKEMERCFHCGRCIECDNCFIYCPDIAVTKKEGGYDIQLDFCKGCGVCVTECPRAAMELKDEPIDL